MSFTSRVMGLLPKGGYAEYAAIDENHVMAVPDGLSLHEAGGIPEVWLTAYQLLHFVGNVKENDIVLIHGGGSGVGTAAVQLVRLAGAIPIVTAGTKDKIDTCLSLGAKNGFNYKEGEFAPGVLEATGGVNLILDCVGGSFWKQNVACLAPEGTWVNYGLLGGANIDGPILGLLLAKRASLLTTTLKSRSNEYKARLISEFSRNALPYFVKPAIVHGQEIRLKPIIDKEFKLESASDAHRHVLGNKNIGKVLLIVQDEKD
uniref:quinone oxidoreductase PIG3-like n=1 Tax=Styela clava TaxID=7725 RepID=UPI0019399E85|nr:quinone oxidoreductase PIG3-like [Styela clava]